MCRTYTAHLDLFLNRKAGKKHSITNLCTVLKKYESVGNRAEIARKRTSQPLTYQE